MFTSIQIIQKTFNIQITHGLIKSYPFLAINQTNTLIKIFYNLIQIQALVFIDITSIKLIIIFSTILSLSNNIFIFIIVFLIQHIITISLNLHFYHFNHQIHDHFHPLQHHHLSHNCYLHQFDHQLNSHFHNLLHHLYHHLLMYPLFHH